jgi:hypothetical protein
MQNLFSLLFLLDICIYKGMGIYFEVGKKRVYEKSSYMLSGHLTCGLAFVFRWLRRRGHTQKKNILYV